MHKILAILLVLVPSLVFSQDVELEKMQRNVSIKNYVSNTVEWDWSRLGEEGMHGPNDEFKDAVDFLYSVDPETRPFIKFFTSYSIPSKLREQAVYTTSFLLHSFVAWSKEVQPNYRPLAVEKNGSFYAHQKVPGSPTLWWIDIRDYGWTNEAFEKVTAQDPYFVSPLVDERLAFLLQAEGLSPNIILRMDWFIREAADAQQQIDTGFDPISDTLIYSRLNAAPKNEKEFEQLWKIDNGNSYYNLVTKSRAVSRHNRVVAVSQGTFGEYYETYDVLNEDGKRDYLENFFSFVKNEPEVTDASEKITFNQLGLQVFALTNQKRELVFFGDPTAVRHSADIIDDVRVRLSHSCIDCHAAGPLFAENTLNDILLHGIKINVPNFDDKADLEAAYLSSGFDNGVKTGRGRFAEAIKRVNGLAPEQNTANYLAMVAWYEKSVTLEQAAAEIGIMPDNLRNGLVGRVSGRAALLVNNGEPIPRQTWDSPGRDGIPGAYQQLMSIVYGLELRTVKITPVTPQKNVGGLSTFATLRDGAYGYRPEARTPTKTLRGTWKVIRVQGDWVLLNVREEFLWVRRKDTLKFEQRPANE